jgi:hypothetical protein
MIIMINLVHMIQQFINPSFEVDGGYFSTLIDFSNIWVLDKFIDFTNTSVLGILIDLDFSCNSPVSNTYLLDFLDSFEFSRLVLSFSNSYSEFQINIVENLVVISYLSLVFAYTFIVMIFEIETS